MSLGMVPWIALLVVLVWAIFRSLERKTSTSGPQETSIPASGPSAPEILRQRYARGEIDTATYEQMRAQLAFPGVRNEQPLAARR
jgi:putative membrane protein